MFVAEPVNPVHTFHDACTLPFCLTADHMSTCLLTFSSQLNFGLLGTRWRMESVVADHVRDNASVMKGCTR